MFPVCRGADSCSPNMKESEFVSLLLAESSGVTPQHALPVTGSSSIPIVRPEPAHDVIGLDSTASFAQGRDHHAHPRLPTRAMRFKSGARETYVCTTPRKPKPPSSSFPSPSSVFSINKNVSPMPVPRQLNLAPTVSRFVSNASRISFKTSSHPLERLRRARLHLHDEPILVSRDRQRPRGVLHPLTAPLACSGADNTAAELATLACPHNPISHVGVNHRMK